MRELKKLMREVKDLILNFFKPYGLSDEILTIPENVKKAGFKVGILSLAVTITSQIFAYMLKISNKKIEERLILLGIIFFMLYCGKQIVRATLEVFKSSEYNRLDCIFADELMIRISQIIGKTVNKVLKYDTSNKLYKLMTPEAESQTIENYLKNMWHQKFQHTFDVFEMISIIIMLGGAIVTNKSIDQSIFIPLLLIFVIISFFSSAYNSLNGKEYDEKSSEYKKAMKVLGNDLLRVPLIVRNDLDMRISKLQKLASKNSENLTKFHKKKNWSSLFVAIMEALSKYGIIVFYLLGVGWDNISKATIIDITATLIIVETALEQIGDIAETLYENNKRITKMKIEEQDMSLILDVYHHDFTSKEVDSINIKPFSIQYLEESENDKPFTLVSKNPIHIGNGEVVILYGPSGSGKSTFMKMLTGRIRVEKSTEIPSTSRFLFYDETLKFGSLSIYEELFCCRENPDLNKMQTILEKLHLWCEKKSNCIDIWKWMKEKQFDQSLSNGQKQRLIIAKMLYWLDEEYDVLVLDECTSGLDEKTESDSADAERIMEYVVRYANRDKKRIIIISTHQNIDGFKNNLSNEFVFKDLQFIKEGDVNLVKEL